MTTERDVNRIVRSWMSEGVTALPDYVLDAVLDQLPATPQRRATRWRVQRYIEMNKPLAIGLVVAAAVLVLALIGLNLGPGFRAATWRATEPVGYRAVPIYRAERGTKPRKRSTPRRGRRTSPISMASASRTRPIGPSNPADHAWTLEADAVWPNTAADKFSSPEDGGIALAAWSVPVEAGTTVEQWIEAYCPLNTTPCTGIDERAVPIYAEVRDQHPGLLVPFQDDIQAFFLNGDRMYVVASWRNAAILDSRRLIEAFCVVCSASARNRISV